MGTRFAAETYVTTEKSKAQIEGLLRSRKVEGFHTGWDATRDIIEFMWNGKQIRFVLPRPNRKDFAYSPAGRTRTEKQVNDAIEQADRQRWRALYLVVRAKIEAVEAGLSIFEEEFMAFVVVPGMNQTIGEIMVPRLKSGDFNVERALPQNASR